MLRRIRELFNDVLRQADLLLLALCGGASLFGVLMVSSATRYMHTNRLVLVQAAALVIGVLLYLLVSQIDVGELVKYWKWIFLVGIGFILLLATPLGIDGGTGNRAWLDFPFLPVKVQPAEIVKITFILVLAKQLAWLKENRDLKSVTSVAMLAVHFGVIFVLYYKISGDMGSALVFLFIFACMCFVAGVALRWFLIGGGAAALLFYAMWDLNLLDSYMKKRFIVLFDHSYDPLNTGWQQTRSLLTLGGGKIFGQGLFKGVQTQSEAASSLPHRHTGELCVHRRGRNDHLPGDRQRGHVSVRHAGHRPDPAVYQLRRLVAGDAVCGHGTGLRRAWPRKTGLAAVRGIS